MGLSRGRRILLVPGVAVVWTLLVCAGVALAERLGLDRPRARAINEATAWGGPLAASQILRFAVPLSHREGWTSWVALSGFTALAFVHMFGLTDATNGSGWLFLAFVLLAPCGGAFIATRPQ